MKMGIKRQLHKSLQEPIPLKMILSQSKFNENIVTLGQGHRKVTQYISPDPYILCPKYVRFGTNVFDVRGKSVCGGGRGGNELKT